MGCMLWYVNTKWHMLDVYSAFYGSHLHIFGAYNIKYYLFHKVRATEFEPYVNYSNFDTFQIV